METTKTYFYKEIVSNGLIVDGEMILFELLDGNRGVIALTPGNPSHDKFIQFLAKNQGKFGIVAINQTEYDAKKNQFPFQPSKQQKEMLRAVKPVTPLHPGGQPVAADKGPKTVPLGIPPVAKVGTSEPPRHEVEAVQPNPPHSTPPPSPPPSEPQSPSSPTAPSGPPSPAPRPAVRRVGGRVQAQVPEAISTVPES